ncbi:MAG: DUF3871 family protein [Bacteroidales bacterium]
MVVKDYYTDESFCRDNSDGLNLWRLYNLFTGANKMSYIDSFLDKGAGCSQFLTEIKNALANDHFIGSWSKIGQMN